MVSRDKAESYALQCIYVSFELRSNLYWIIQLGCPHLFRLVMRTWEAWCCSFNSTCIFMSHEEWAVQRSTFSDLMPARSYRKPETCNKSCLHSKLRTTHIFADGKRFGTTARAAGRHVHERITAKSLLHKANKTESQDAPKPHSKVLKPKTCKTCIG